jgi:hypothetical protein
MRLASLPNALQQDLMRIDRLTLPPTFVESEAKNRESYQHETGAKRSIRIRKNWPMAWQTLTRAHD